MNSLKNKISTVMATSLFSILILAAPTAQAVNPRILTVSRTMFASGTMDSYTQYAESALLDAGNEFCKSFGESLESVSNVVLQIQTTFVPKGAGNLEATINPQVSYSGLVSCHAAAR